MLQIDSLAVGTLTNRIDDFAISGEQEKAQILLDLPETFS